MFNRIEVKAPQPATKKVTITENRAPTDQSVQLLQEMQRQAQDNLLGQVKVETTWCKDARVTLFKTSMPGQTECCVQFNINGQDYTQQQVVNKVIDLRQVQARELIEMVESFLTKIIRNMLLEDTVAQYVTALQPHAEKRGLTYNG